MTAAAPLAAAGEGDGERQASWLELFFDLVFVATVAALAGTLHDDHSATGLVVFAALFLPVWWVWRGFTWYAAAFDTGELVFRLALLGAMVGAGAVAVGVQGAAHRASATFAVACGCLFLLLAALYGRMWRATAESRAHTGRYAAGNAAGGVLWLASLLVGEGARPVVWAVALVVLVAPAVAVLALPYRAFADAGLIAERYGLFTLIVLGESVVRTIDGLRADGGGAATVVALSGAGLAATIWWLYFHRFRAMPDVSRGARFVWAQAHVLVFAGIAATAVGVELLVEAAAAGEAPVLDERLPLAAGLATYLVGMAVIRGATRTADAVVALRTGTAVLLVVVALVAGGASAVAFALLATALLGGEAGVELRRSPPPAPA